MFELTRSVAVACAAAPGVPLVIKLDREQHIVKDILQKEEKTGKAA